jgi:hypothetical protein
MRNSNQLTPEERAKIVEIQDLLTNLYVEQKESLDKGQKARAIALQFEIRELKRKIQEIKSWATV